MGTLTAWTFRVCSDEEFGHERTQRTQGRNRALTKPSALVSPTSKAERCPPPLRKRVYIVYMADLTALKRLQKGLQRFAAAFTSQDIQISNPSYERTPAKIQRMNADANVTKG